MTPYTTPDMPYADAVTRDIATQITHATHVSLSQEDAPTIGPWRPWAGIPDDYYPSPMPGGERPVGWVIVPTRKRGPVLAWCESWRQSRAGWHAQIVWTVGEYVGMTDSDLKARKAYEQARADQERTGSPMSHSRGLRYGNAWANISRIVEEQRRRVVADILRAGAEQAAEVVA